MPYPIAHYVNCDKFSLQHHSFLAVVIANKEPTSYVEIVKDARWREVMKKEIEALENNETWIVEDLLPGKKLVILGNNQVEVIDYNETFALVAKMVTV